jgi:hypothetical protein
MFSHILKLPFNHIAHSHITGDGRTVLCQRTIGTYITYVLPMTRHMNAKATREEHKCGEDGGRREKP